MDYNKLSDLDDWLKRVDDDVEEGDEKSVRSERKPTSRKSEKEMLRKKIMMGVRRPKVCSRGTKNGVRSIGMLCCFVKRQFCGRMNVLLKVARYFTRSE